MVKARVVTGRWRWVDPVGNRAPRGLDRGWLITFLAIVALVVGRSPQAFAWPALEVDDGILAAEFCADPTWHGILAPHEGYVTILPHAIGWLAAFLPIGWWPALYAAMAATLAALALAAFASQRFAAVVPDARVRSLLCLLVALAPHGNLRCVTGAMYAHLSCAALFTLFAGVALPDPGWRRKVDFGVRALLCCSSPLCIAALPVLVWRAWRTVDRGERRMHAAMVVLGGCYGVWLCAPGMHVHAAPGRLLAGFVRLLDQRILAEAAVGGVTWPELGGMVHAVAALVAFATLRWCAPLTGAQRQFAGALLVGIVVMSAMTVYGREHLGVPDRWWGNRYTYVQRVLFHLLLGMAAAHAAAAMPIARRRAFACVGIAHAVLLAAIGSEQYRAASADGQRVAAFCARAEIWAEQDRAQRTPLRLERRGGWDITLR